MEPMALKPILSNLNEAHGEMLRLFARLQFIVFGEVLDEDAKNLEASVAAEERRQQLTEGVLFVSMANAYHHLNLAWNCRHAPDESVRRCEPADFKRWSKFPQSSVFRRLWPAPSQCRGVPRKPGHGRIKPNSLQAAFLQMAIRKLSILRYRVSCAIGEDASVKVERPKGLKPEIDDEPFTEATFGRRLGSVYVQMNWVWAYRKWTSCGDLSRQAIHRRSQFPSAFIHGVMQGFC